MYHHRGLTQQHIRVALLSGCDLVRSDFVRRSLLRRGHRRLTVLKSIRVTGIGPGRWRGVSLLGS